MNRSTSSSAFGCIFWIFFSHSENLSFIFFSCLSGHYMFNMPKNRRTEKIRKLYFLMFCLLFAHKNPPRYALTGLILSTLFSCIFCIFCKITLFVFFVFPNCNPQRKASSNQTFSCLFSSTNIITICTCGSIVRIITLNADIHAANTSTNAEPISSIPPPSVIFISAAPPANQ